MAIAGNPVNKNAYIGDIMNFEYFLNKEKNKYRKKQLENISDDFINSNYERYLLRSEKEINHDANKTTLKNIDAEKYIINRYVNDFINQFSEFIDIGIIYIYPESYNDNYFMIRELCKESKYHRIINNLFPDDESINHIAIFSSNKIREIYLMNHLVYSSSLSGNFGGYKLYGIDVIYYLYCLSEKDFIYTIRPPFDFMNYQGIKTRRDNDPLIIYDARKNINHIIELEYFKNEYEFYRNLRLSILPYLNNFYIKAKEIESQYSYDWKKEKTILKSDLISQGVINPKWKNEKKLFLAIKKIYPDTLFQYKPNWLSPQNYDIFIPSINLAIEYDGIQHYQSIDFFGGDDALSKRKKLDERKMDLSNKHHVKLVKWKYDQEINQKNLTFFLNQINNK